MRHAARELRSLRKPRVGRGTRVHLDVEVGYFLLPARFFLPYGEFQTCTEEEKVG